MTLTEYISTIGDRAAAKLFGVSYWTARSWRLGLRYPRREQAASIVSLTDGKVTFAGIYGVTESRPSGRRE